jgi:hypothetical protein
VCECASMRVCPVRLCTHSATGGLPRLMTCPLKMSRRSPRIPLSRTPIPRIPPPSPRPTCPPPHPVPSRPVPPPAQSPASLRVTAAIPAISPRVPCQPPPAPSPFTLHPAPFTLQPSPYPSSELPPPPSVRRSVGPSVKRVRRGVGQSGRRGVGQSARRESPNRPIGNRPIAQSAGGAGRPVRWAGRRRVTSHTCADPPLAT